MKRALLPNILASFGLVLIMWASTMPLFEWQTSFITSDYPPDYKVHLVPSPWITKLGESLDNRSYISRKIFLSIDPNACWIGQGQKIRIERSTIDGWLDGISNQFNNVFLWLALGSLILIILSGIYMWWIIVWREHRTIAEAVASTIIILILFSFPVGMRLLGPKLSLDYFFGLCDNNYGTVTFSAEISKVHYGMPIVMLSAILAELGAAGKMLYEIVRAVKESSELTVG